MESVFGCIGAFGSVADQIEVECHDLFESFKEHWGAENSVQILNPVAVSKTAGLIVKEIAAELQTAERTVERRLSLIPSLWCETISSL
ncbi:MAG: hypothetical protein CMM07_00215 [Rhodopirellula sp.]|nr:hypothetical protein [Rhodopirellula sp.]